MTPLEQTLEALDELVREGLVTAIGCSNFSAAQLEEAEVAPACERLGVSILPYFPLASGLLSGKYRRGPSSTG